MRIAPVTAMASLMLGSLMLTGCTSPSQSAQSSGDETALAASYTVKGVSTAGATNSPLTGTRAGGIAGDGGMAFGPAGETIAESVGVTSGDNQPRP